jgi:hypothetical protein
MVIVEALKKCDVSSGVYGGVVCDIISKLSNFDLYDFSFVRRCGNSVAHEVTKLAVSISLHQLWINSFPSSLSVCIRRTIVILAFNETMIYLQKKKKRLIFPYM